MKDQHQHRLSWKLRNRPSHQLHLGYFTNKNNIALDVCNNKLCQSKKCRIRTNGTQAQWERGLAVRASVSSSEKKQAQYPHHDRELRTTLTTTEDVE